MNNTNIFEQASRMKFRFPSPLGPLATEDLWQLPLTSATGKANLNDIGKALNKQVRDTGEENFVPVAGQTASDTTKIVALDIVKRVIEVKLAENAAKASVEATKTQNQRILEILAQKQDHALTEKTEDELRAMLAPV